MTLVLPYVWLDVFASEPFAGNQLCVFTGADALPPSLMVQVTRELNHSETTFLQKPATPGADSRIRIWIPTGAGAAEVPFAGHPILGSACVAAREQDRRSTLAFETGVGVIPVTVIPVRDGVWDVRMAQPLPRLVRRILATRQALAEALSLPPEAIRTDLPVEAVENGLQTVLIPLASVDAVRNAIPDMVRLRALLGRDGLSTLIFAPGGVDPGSHVHCRVFSPFDLVPEDPATGSANGPLGEYLVRHQVVDGFLIRSEQGYEIGRPSRITVEVEQEEGTATAIFVSGRVQQIGRGEFRLG